MKRLKLASLIIALSPIYTRAEVHFEPFREVTTGVFGRLGTSEKVLLGAKTTILSTDGILNPLDIGAAASSANLLDAHIVLGPSVKLSEPIKALLLSGIHLLKDDAGYLEKILAPGNSGWALNLGPGLDIRLSDHLKEVTGRFSYHAGLSKRF